MIDPGAVIAAIGSILTAVVGAGVRGVWVFGWTYRQKAAESDFWRDAFLRSVGQTDQAIQVAKKVTRG